MYEEAQTLTLRRLILEDWRLCLKKVKRGIYSDGTRKNTKTKLRHVLEFMNLHGYRNILAKDVRYVFCEKFKDYLLYDKGEGNAHCMRIIRMVKAVLLKAEQLERIERSRVVAFNTNITDEYKENNLELDELVMIKQQTFRKPLHRVAKLYNFCCYTGLAFMEMYNFDYFRDVTTDQNGIQWIKMNRNKTGRGKEVFFYVPLFPEALAILKEYDYQLPVVSLKTINEHLKEIAVICNIKINLTSHTARKTFGIIAMERDGFSLEALSHMLGHKSIKTTEKHYARVRKRTVEKQLLNLRPDMYARMTIVA